jgi:hypothetical protein
VRRKCSAALSLHLAIEIHSAHMLATFIEASFFETVSNRKKTEVAREQLRLEACGHSERIHYGAVELR